uniref:Plethodontid modulating factor n=1 Tax=Plethodon shermani TaxID=263671 RepID=Q0GAX6_9SALA|nr:plethodontid modulating factor [Plethodon shermani]
MRTTALLILLVVLVSTGEALKCNTLNGGIDECHTDVCAHYKFEGEVIIGCWIQSFCEEDKAALAAEGSEDMFICCSEDLCN